VPQLGAPDAASCPSTATATPRPLSSPWPTWQRILEEKDNVEKLALQGAELHATTPQALTTLLHNDRERWAAVVKQSSATVD
jgi:tripartite-type tricarboxylate transporter receptor subunit TctC